MEVAVGLDAFGLLRLLRCIEHPLQNFFADGALVLRGINCVFTAVVDALGTDLGRQPPLDQNLRLGASALRFEYTLYFVDCRELVNTFEDVILFGIHPYFD